MTLRGITTVYFWICALLSPLALIMFALGVLGIVSFAMTGHTPRDAWTGSSPRVVPYILNCLVYILTPIWGFRVWLIHRATLKGNESGASRRWGETALFNIGFLTYLLYWWSQDFDHDTYFIVFILPLCLTAVVALTGICIWMKS
jgi:uncharacterized membrane protein